MEPQWKRFTVDYRRPDRKDWARGGLLGASAEPPVGMVKAAVLGLSSVLLPCVRVRRSAV